MHYTPVCKTNDVDCTYFIINEPSYQSSERKNTTHPWNMTILKVYFNQKDSHFYPPQKTHTLNRN